MNYSPQELFEQLQHFSEQPHIEAKRGREIGDSIMQTICAFANQPGLGGGYILLGICEPDAEHNSFHICGVEDTDTLLNNLQVNCRTQFEHPIQVEAEVARIDGKTIIQVFIPELEANAKPCRFIAKPGSKNKKKTGVWLRGINGDYECTHEELEPLLIAKAGNGFERTIPADAEWDDLDPSAIELYRKLRAQVRPHAEELNASDQDMLRALNLVQKQNGELVPNIAGLLLFGKPLALRRLLPAARTDYVRIAGIQWVENPHQRFETTLDLREPILRLIPKLEASILDDLPKHFKLQEGHTQRQDQPLLPQRVIREAIVNAVMHRDYQVHSPILVARYSNRIEIQNAGYSLKPEIDLGQMGSKLRNPIIASVLYDIDFAETKGSGIGTMRALLKEAGLNPPVFHSSPIKNQFNATYLLHQLLGQDQLAWLKQFAHLQLSDDEAKALILAKETGAIDNAGLRAITGLDTLASSKILGKLHHNYGLLSQSGAGSTTYYELSELDELPLFKDAKVNTSDLSSFRGDLSSFRGDLSSFRGDLSSFRGDLSNFRGDLNLPSKLLQTLKELNPRSRKSNLWPAIVWLCSYYTFNVEQMGLLLDRNQKSLKSNHLNPLRTQEKLLEYTYPEVPNHPEQAYKATEKGLKWLKSKGIHIASQQDTQ